MVAVATFLLPSAYTRLFPSAFTPFSCLPANMIPLSSSLKSVSLYSFPPLIVAVLKKSSVPDVIIVAAAVGSVISFVSTVAPSASFHPVGTAEAVPLQPAKPTLFTSTLLTVYFTAAPSDVTSPVAVAEYLIICASS